MKLEQYIIDDVGYAGLLASIQQLIYSPQSAQFEDQLLQIYEMIKHAHLRLLTSGRLDFFARYLSYRAQSLLETILPAAELEQFFRDMVSQPKDDVRAALVTRQNEVMIEFCHDSEFFIERSKNLSEKKRAKLHVLSPHDDLEKYPQSFDPGTRLTILAHCQIGSSYLSDNSGNTISCEQLARYISAKMIDKNAPLLITLIACYAATDSETGKPSFSKQFVQALADQGIHNVIVRASMTSLSHREDGDVLNSDAHTQEQQHVLDQYEIYFDREFGAIAESVLEFNDYFREVIYEELEAFKEKFIASDDKLHANVVEKLQEDILKAETISALFQCLRQANEFENKLPMKARDTQLLELYATKLRRIYLLQEEQGENYFDFCSVQARTAKALRELAQKYVDDPSTKHIHAEQVYQYRDQILETDTHEAFLLALRESKEKNKKSHPYWYGGESLDRILICAQLQIELSQLQLSPTADWLLPEQTERFNAARKKIYFKLSERKEALLIEGEEKKANHITGIQKVIVESVSADNLIHLLKEYKRQFLSGYFDKSVRAICDNIIQDMQHYFLPDQEHQVSTRSTVAENQLEYFSSQTWASFYRQYARSGAPSTHTSDSKTSRESENNIGEEPQIPKKQ